MNFSEMRLLRDVQLSGEVSGQDGIMDPGGWTELPYGVSLQPLPVSPLTKCDYCATFDPSYRCESCGAPKKPPTQFYIAK